MLNAKLVVTLFMFSVYSAITCAANSLPNIAFKAVEISDVSSPAISQLVKIAAKSIQSTPSTARDLLIEALYKIDRGVDVCEYDYLWIQYGLLKSSFESEDDEFTVGTESDYMKVAAQAISFLDQETATGIWQFTDLGQFQMEVYRVAGNGLAWLQLKRGKSQAEWQQALSTVEKAVSHIRGVEDYYVLDTKVRILLKLGRKREAYKIVREVLKEVPDFTDFQDLKAYL
jgi:tetratricopeptide (TPR) repeat protein